MAQKGRAVMKTVNVNTGITAISATGAGTAVNLPDCQEAVLLLDCTVVTASGNVTPAIQYSPDGGTTWVTPAGDNFSAVSAAPSRQVAHITGLGGHNGQIRLNNTLNSGTSVNIVVEAVGLLPGDSSTIADQI